MVALSPIIHKNNGTDKLISVRVWIDPEVSRRMRLPDFVTIVGKVVSTTHRPPLHPTKYIWYSFPLEADSTLRS
jgi:flavin reductase (DIM6/NTAB) family NADH-FMN oxidoreductase RutF